MAATCTSVFKENTITVVHLQYLGFWKVNILSAQCADLGGGSEGLDTLEN